MVIILWILTMVKFSCKRYAKTSSFKSKIVKHRYFDTKKVIAEIKMRYGVEDFTIIRTDSLSKRKQEIEVIN